MRVGTVRARLGSLSLLLTVHSHWVLLSRFVNPSSARASPGLAGIPPTRPALPEVPCFAEPSPSTHAVSSRTPARQLSSENARRGQHLSSAHPSASFCWGAAGRGQGLWTVSDQVGPCTWAMLQTAPEGYFSPNYNEKSFCSQVEPGSSAHVDAPLGLTRSLSQTYSAYAETTQQTHSGVGRAGLQTTTHQRDRCQRAK